MLWRNRVFGVGVLFHDYFLTRRGRPIPASSFFFFFLGFSFLRIRMYPNVFVCVWGRPIYSFGLSSTLYKSPIRGGGGDKTRHNYIVAPTPVHMPWNCIARRIFHIFIEFCLADTINVIPTLKAGWKESHMEGFERMTFSCCRHQLPTTPPGSGISRATINTVPCWNSYCLYVFFFFAVILKGSFFQPS